jgi:lipid-A-disaccharide synthase
MFVILPFEKEFYARYDCDVDFVGHPLLDMIAALPENDHNSFRKSYGLTEEPIIALLPGSRKQEISKMLSFMVSVIPQFSGYQFVVAGAPSVEVDFYKSLTGNSNVKLISGATHALLQNSFAALVTSGTATLETALFNVPEVVCYKGSYISYQIAKRVIDQSIIKYISLVNLIMDREVVKELIQHDLNRANLVTELTKITGEKVKREQMLDDYSQLRKKLGGPGASENTAHLIMKYLTNELG